MSGRLVFLCGKFSPSEWDLTQVLNFFSFVCYFSVCYYSYKKPNLHTYSISKVSWTGSPEQVYRLCLFHIVSQIYLRIYHTKLTNLPGTWTGAGFVWKEGFAPIVQDLTIFITNSSSESHPVTNLLNKWEDNLDQIILSRSYTWFPSSNSFHYKFGAFYNILKNVPKM